MTPDNSKEIVAEPARQMAERPKARCLSDGDRDVFLELLNNPPAPNDALRATAADFKQAVKRSALIP